MNRRTYLTSILSGTLAAGRLAAQNGRKPIELHVDLQVDPAKEKEMLKIFHGPFHAAAAQQAGFIDAKMLHLRSAVKGSAPPDANYRFVLRFQSEEQRQAWIATPIHQQLWPKIEQTLASQQYTVLLYDVT
jgi:antibiotic biosynthesis monooxygenase (ABM) superfamily enzyme